MALDWKMKEPSQSPALTPLLVLIEDVIDSGDVWSGWPRSRHLMCNRYSELACCFYTFRALCCTKLMKQPGNDAADVFDIVAVRIDYFDYALVCHVISLAISAPVHGLSGNGPRRFVGRRKVTMAK